MKKVLFSAAILLITSAIDAQTSEEKTMEDGSVVIVYTPKAFTKDELAKFNRRKRMIPTPEQLVAKPTLLFSNACMDNLENEFDMIIRQDSSLYEASKNCFLSHIYKDESHQEKTPVRYHQIWTLPESTINFDHKSFASGLTEMMKDNNLHKVIHRQATFFCHEFEYENKFYLVAIVND
jgi:hypothetical protein